MGSNNYEIKILRDNNKYPSNSSYCLIKVTNNNKKDENTYSDSIIYYGTMNSSTVMPIKYKKL